MGLFSIDPALADITKGKGEEAAVPEAVPEEVIPVLSQGHPPKKKKAPRWSKVASHPTYLKATPAQKSKIRWGYFQRYVQDHPNYQDMAPKERASYRLGFLRHPDTLTEKDTAKLALADLTAKKKLEQGDEPSTFRKDLTDEIAKMPPALQGAASFGAGVIEGVTIDAVEIPELSDQAVLSGIKSAGNFAGYIAPITASVKTAQGILALGGTAGKVALKTKVGAEMLEGALTGLLFGLGKGALHGEDTETTLTEAGYTAAFWSVLNPAARKMFEYAGALIELGGKKLAERAVRKAARQLERETGISAESADDVIAAIEQAGVKLPKVKGKKGEGKGKGKGKKAKAKAEEETAVVVKTSQGKKPVGEVKKVPKVQKVQKVQKAKGQKAQAADALVKDITVAKKAAEALPEHSLTAPGAVVPPARRKGAFLKKKTPLEAAVDKVQAEEAGGVSAETGKEVVLEIVPRGTPDRLAAIRAAAERAKTKKTSRSLEEPRAKPVEEVDVPLPANVQMARPEKGLPFATLTKAELDAEVRRSKVTGAISGEEQLLGDFLNLQMGIPVNQARAVVRWMRRKLGEATTGKGGVFPMIRTLIQSLNSPSFIARLNKQAAEIVNINLDLRSSLLRRGTNTFMRQLDITLKGMSDKQLVQVSKLMNKYNNIAEIPPELLVRLSPEVLKAFKGSRRILNRIWDMYTRTKSYQKTLYRTKMVGGKRVRVARERPQKIHAYLPRVFEDLSRHTPERQKQIVASFADETGQSYDKALQVLGLRQPREGFFGPMSKGRLLDKEGNPVLPDLEQIWDLRFLMEFYIKGSMRKIYLDELLRTTEPLRKKLLEGTREFDMVNGYLNRQRGIPSNKVEGFLMGEGMIPETFRKLAFYEALRQYTSKLGARPVAALINATQYPLFDGALAMGAAMKDRSMGPLQNFAKGALVAMTRRGEAAAHRAGVIFVEGRGEIPLADLKGFWPKVARLAGTLFQWVEKKNKTASYIFHYNEFGRILTNFQKMHPELQLTGQQFHDAARRYAIGSKGVARSQFFADVGDKPSALVGPLGSMIGRFKTFPIKSMEFVAGLDRYEALAFLGLVDAIGGPDAVPGLRQLRFEMNESHPNSKITAALNAMQKHSVAGYAELDLGYVTGLGFIPGANMHTDFMDKWTRDFWGTIGQEVPGVTISDISNLYKDIDTGQINFKDVQLDDWLALRSGTAINVQLQQVFRWLQESETGYIEYSRGRPGIPLTERDAALRAVSLTSSRIQRIRQTFANDKKRIEEANEEKVRIEDRLFYYDDELGKTDDPGRVEKLTKLYAATLTEIQEFNDANMSKKVPVFVSGRTIAEAIKNRHLPLSMRQARSLLHMQLLSEKLMRADREPWNSPYEEQNMMDMGDSIDPDMLDEY